MRAMSDSAFDALCTQPATAGMRAMPQGVIGGARARKLTTPLLSRAALQHPGGKP